VDLSEDMFRMLLSEGIAAAKDGNKSLAYQLLQKATKVNPDGELGWLWLAGVSESPQEAVEYLKRVLAINPANQHAISGLKWAQGKLAEAQDTEGSERSAGWCCPLCQTQFTEQLTVCRSCGAVLTFNDLDALMRNKGAKQAIILDAIERLRNGEEDEASFDTHYHLALAYLNLGQIDGGTVRLRQALRLRPDDSFLISRLEELTRIASAKHEVEEVGSTVLVVDDSPTICRLVKITLEREGYRVITAADGQEGLAKIIAELPDLVLLDITMPRMNGYQLCKSIKTTQETANIPVIMLSGKDDVADREMGRKVGSSGYITKPFEPDELVEFVREYAIGNHA
jgi:twitching motility two-component system response regulator PilG